MRRLLSRKGQTTLEYAILIAVVVAGLIGMQVYVKRGVQGRLRGASDDIGSQYSPEKVTSSFTTTTSSTSNEVISAGETTTTVTQGDRERTGRESVEDLSQEPWNW